MGAIYEQSANGLNELYFHMGHEIAGFSATVCHLIDDLAEVGPVGSAASWKPSPKLLALHEDGADIGRFLSQGAKINASTNSLATKVEEITTGSAWAISSVAIGLIFGEEVGKTNPILRTLGTLIGFSLATIMLMPMRRAGKEIVHGVVGLIKSAQFNQSLKDALHSEGLS